MFGSARESGDPLCPSSANDAGDHQQSGENVGRTTHTKTQIVVAVVRIVVVAIAETRITLSIVPGAATHNTPPV